MSDEIVPTEQELKAAQVFINEWDTEWSLGVAATKLAELIASHTRYEGKTSEQWRTIAYDEMGRRQSLASKLAYAEGERDRLREERDGLAEWICGFEEAETFGVGEYPEQVRRAIASAKAMREVCEAAKDYCTEREYQNLEAFRIDQDRRENVLLVALAKLAELDNPTTVPQVGTEEKHP